MAHVNLCGLWHGAGRREARWQPDVLQRQVGGPLHGVVGGPRARGEVVADAVGRDGQEGEGERLRRRDVREAHDRREVGLVDISERRSNVSTCLFFVHIAYRAYYFRPL